jgi:cellulose synthase/poly-beta-1,6-N-acetylglucosamine synthase-like glycosyltransferase
MRVGSEVLTAMSAATGLLALYFTTLLILSVYGLHRYALVYLYYRHRKRAASPAPPPPRWPRVTIQLPVYNEMYVVERLLDSVARIRYPRDRLQVQLLDDSSDETRAIAERRVRFHRREGLDVEYRHRAERRGFKAGALAEGLAHATGEFILILDADFIPPPEFLERTLGHFADAGVGMVQARWDHVNRGYSLLTEVQAILLDAHFVLEHGGRHRSGRFFNFNGTAGIWRRSAIEDAGGWEGDTLTEDLDLSYRAQLRGWRFVFLPDVTAPAELPVEMNAFKSQQLRWAKGTAQTCLKLLPRILGSALPARVKLEAWFHLTAPATYPLMVLLAVLLPPAIAIRGSIGAGELLLLDIPLFAAATASVTSFYLVAERELRIPWKGRRRLIPAVLAVGIGLSVSNARGVLEALLGRRSGFERTPKHRVESRSDDWRGKRYRGRAGAAPWVELALGLYLTAAAVHAAAAGLLGPLPFVVLFQAGFLYSALTSFIHRLRPSAA